MNPTPDSPRQRTRRAILDAVADVIVQSRGLGFSVQEVADRAGLSHRTVYNHFPTREALCEGFSAYVDELLLSSDPAPDDNLSLASFPAVVDPLYRALETRERYVRAYVMLMIGSRRPVKTWRKRTQLFETLIAREAAVPPPLTVHQVTAAIRMFVSSMGWHLLTEHLGLSTDEAAATGAWATRTLLDAATLKQGSMPRSKRSKRGTHAKGDNHAKERRRG